jgi:hypothetical protein
MKTSAYIDYLVSEMGSHLWRMTDKERENYHSVANNLNNPWQGVNYKSRYLRDFFNYYLKEMEFTPQQFVSALGDDRRLIDDLYSGYTAYIADRNELQEIFEPVIRKDVKMFNAALGQCLDTHHNLYQNEHPDNQEKAAQIERNTATFKRLLEIGGQEEIFRKLPKDAFFTKNSLYKDLMQQKGLLENESFDEKKLIQLFDEVAQNRRNSNFDKVAEYCLFYIKDVVEKFDSPGTFNAWAATHINNKLDKDGKTVKLMGASDFFQLITKDVNHESRPYQDKFIAQWLDNMTFRQKISTGFSSNLQFFKQHPHQITKYLDKLTDLEKVELIDKGIRDCDFGGRWTHGFVEFITKLPMESAPPLQQAEIIERMIDFRKVSRNSDDVMADNAFFSAALNYLVDKSFKSIKNSLVSDEEKALAKQNVLSVYAKNSDIIVSLIHDAKNAVSKNFENLDNNLKELRLHKRELNLTSEFFDDLESIASSKLELYFSKKADNNQYNYMSNLLEGIRDSVSVASALGIYPVLDKLDLLNIKINKEEKIYGSKRTKHFDEYPAIFDIIENNADKGVLGWILQEKHIPALKETAIYKGRNVVEFFSIYEDTNRPGKQPIIEKLFEVMMEDKAVFKELVLSKKKTMKAVKELKSEFIQTSLEVATLDNILKSKDEEPVKRISRKI